MEVRKRSKMCSLGLGILFFVLPIYAALTKTTTINVIDDWQHVASATLAEGAAEDISTSYGTVLYIEVALDSTAQSGCDVIVEISYGDDNWMELATFQGTAETATSTTINDAAVNAGDTTITLTDATTGDFDVPGRKWFIVDGTVASSEAVRTKVVSGNTVTLCQDLLRSHADGLTVYDRVDEWSVSIPMAASFVRTLVNNTDTDATVHFTTRDSEVTGL